METKKYAVIYAFGTKDDGREICEGTKMRIETGLNFIQGEGGVWVIVLGAGKDPKRPYRDSLKDLMYGHICRRLHSLGFKTPNEKEFSNGTVTIIIERATGNPWGTFLETLAITKVISRNASPGVITVVSSSFHMMRIRVIWKFFPYDINPIPYDSPRPWQDHVWELLKLTKVIFYGIRYKLGMLN